MTPSIRKPPPAADSSHAFAEEAANRATADAHTAHSASLLKRARGALPVNEDLAQDAVVKTFVRYFKALSRGATIKTPGKWLNHALTEFEIPDAIKAKTRQGHLVSTDPALLEAIADSQPFDAPAPELSPEDLVEVQSSIADMFQPAGLTQGETEVMRVLASVITGITTAGDLNEKQALRAINEAIAAQLSKDIKTVTVLKSKALKKLKTYQATRLVPSTATL